MTPKKIILLIVIGAIAFACLVTAVTAMVNSSSRQHSREATQIVRGACGSDTLDRFNTAFAGQEGSVRLAEAYKWAVRCADKP